MAGAITMEEEIPTEQIRPDSMAADQTEEEATVVEVVEIKN